MTKRSEATKRKLMQDIEAYTCGEAPNPLHLRRAARLENWSTAVRRRGKEFALAAVGDVYQHPEIADGTNISTPAVMWFDRKARFIRTHNRLYVLGEPAGGDIPIDGIDS
jgi:hypothetical protein